MSNRNHFRNSISRRPESWGSCNNLADLKDQSPCERHLQAFDAKGVRKKKNQEYLKEVWSVQQVPYSFEGVSKPSAAVERLLSLRKEDHDAEVQNFEKELETLHRACEVEIEELEKVLQNEICTFRTNVEKLKNDFCEIKCLDNENYDELENLVIPELSQEKDAIDNFFESIISVEMKRQNNATEIFIKYYKILRGLFCLQQDDLRKLMERKILEYNKTALNKHKDYEKYKLKLRLCADVFKQKFYTWLKELKRNRLAVCQKNVLNEFYIENENFKNAGSEYFKIIEGKTALCRLKSRSYVISDTIAQWDISVPFSAAIFEEQFYQINSVITSIDSTVVNFIKYYKFYICRYLGRLSDKLDKLKMIVESSETSDDDVEAAQEIYDKAKEDVDDFIEKLELTWSCIFSNLQNKAERTLKIFHDFGSPWDEQSNNFLKLQENILLQLETRTIKSELVHLDLQQKLNAEITKLREEDSVPKLEKRLTQVVPILDRKTQKYTLDFEEDCKIVRKCRDSVAKEVAAMQNKISKFLQANPLNGPSKSEKSSLESVAIDDNCFCELNLNELILKQLQLIDNQADSFDDWKSKFLSNISSHLPSLEKDIMARAQLWEDALINEVTHCVDENLKLVEELRSNINKEIYDVRLNELLDHQQQLEIYKKLITGLISESTKCIVNLLDFTDFIEEYKLQVLQMIEEYGSNAKLSCQIICLLNMLKKERNDFISKFNTRINAITEQLGKKIAFMKNQNDSYLAKIILFKDGGNYGLEEVTLAKKETTTLVKQVQKNESENRSKIKKVQESVISQINKFDKTNLESLNVTIQKLKMQEDICTALKKCDFLAVKKMELLMDLNNEVLEKFGSFMEKCENKSDVIEVVLALEQLIKAVQKNFQFTRGPFPDIDIPKNITFSNADYKNNIVKDKICKVHKLSIKSNSSQQNFGLNDDQYKSDVNYPATILKLIQDTLLIINNNAMTYFTVLINKQEHYSFPDKNEACESCIDNSLNQLNFIYTSAFNFWTDETSKFLKFIETLEMPSIDSYLVEEDVSDEGKEQSSDSLDMMTNDPNCYMTIKVDENFIQFQNVLQQMLSLLQTKDKNIHISTNLQ